MEPTSRSFVSLIGVKLELSGLSRMRVVETIKCSRFEGLLGGMVHFADKDSERPTEKPVMKDDRPKRASGKDRNVGDALRAVYREAVDESIPSELLDLLNKLG